MDGGSKSDAGGCVRDWWLSVVERVGRGGRRGARGKADHSERTEQSIRTEMARKKWRRRTRKEDERSNGAQG